MTEETKKEAVKETKEEPKEETKEETKEKPKEEKKKEPVKVPEKFKKLIEEIEKMSVLDLAELVKVLEKKFGVSATPVAVVPAAGAPGVAPVEEEKTVFNVVLTAIGEKKIEVIKTVRDITQKGLKEAKDLVDAAATGPQVVKENVKKEEAEEMKKKFETVGAKVELK
ncbi:MAG: 50S ribosomal protein L7/L12 [Candidatus Pacebacteria bacterium]|nr:50S ribosomal protein L7/L12 [Candidatus Paceibacterota bacterium]